MARITIGSHLVSSDLVINFNKCPCVARGAILLSPLDSLYSRWDSPGDRRSHFSRARSLARAHGMCIHRRITRIRKGKMIHCSILDPNTMLCIINYLIFWRCTSFLSLACRTINLAHFFRGDIDCDSFCLDFASMMLRLIINTTLNKYGRQASSTSAIANRDRHLRLSLLIIFIYIYRFAIDR